MSVAITAEDFDYAIDMEGIDVDEMEEAAEPIPFPIMIYWAALVKDGFDMLTFGFGSYISSPMLGVVIFFWMWGKSSFMKKMLRKMAAKHIRRWAIRKSIPIVNALPWTTLLVTAVYKEETKIVKMIDELLGEFYMNKEIALRDIINAYYEA